MMTSLGTPLNGDHLVLLSADYPADPGVKW